MVFLININQFDMMIKISNNKNMKKTISQNRAKELIEILKVRFEKNINLHKDITWSNVEKKLESNIEKLWSINEMEITGGEPDVIGYDKKTNEYIFCDCSAESPKERRSFCYDKKALDERKENKPKNNAVDAASNMGIEILTEDQYRELQKLGNFDMKTSSWLATPDSIRKLGGAIFGDFRYNNVFIYHNGAESYYSARGFRGTLKF